MVHSLAIRLSYPDSVVFALPEKTPVARLFRATFSRSQRTVGDSHALQRRRGDLYRDKRHEPAELRRPNSVERLTRAACCLWRTHFSVVLRGVDLAAGAAPQWGGFEADLEGCQPQREVQVRRSSLPSLAQN